MAALRFLIALILFATPPALAQAQAWQPNPDTPAVDPHRYQAEQHRFEMERLRARADQREAFARQLETEARLNRQQIEAARPPEPVQPPAPRALRSPEQERALRLSTSRRRNATAPDVGQIDAWLDRRQD